MYQSPISIKLSGANDLLPVVIVPLSAIRAGAVPLAGGKAANLGELIAAGFPVPDGFCVTTAAYELFAAHVRIEPLLEQLAAVDPGDGDRLAQLAERVRALLAGAAFPEPVAEELRRAYQDLAGGQPLPVAVRSSATAEDLPSASFAGQQDTYLNVIGIDAVLDAVQRCWASLWSDRAVAYRASQGIDPRMVRLAVVVQCMVDAEAAGVLFTANPLTGRRHQAVINASLGLGEAVVSGLVNPDHIVVDARTGAILERRVGDKRLRVRPLPGGGVEQEAVGSPAGSLSLTDELIVALARLGEQVEAHFGSPQDIEWAIDNQRQIWLTQARPITTLYPMPADAPQSGDELRVYLSFNVQQGSYRPFTPMGVSATRLLASSFMHFAGLPLSDPLAGPAFVKEAGWRVYFDVTGALRSSFGRTLLSRMMAQAEARASAIFGQLADDARLSLRPGSRRALVRIIGLFLLRLGAVWTLPQTLLSPQAGRARLLRVEQMLRDAAKVEPDASAQDRLKAVENLLLTAMSRLLPAVFPVMIGDLASLELAKALLGDEVTASELQIALRGLPFNPTTDMTLALWSLAQQIQADPSLIELLGNTPADRLSEDYLQGKLPSVLQTGMADLLSVHGHRSVNELDLGAPRWSEDPAYLFGMLAGYLGFRDPERVPDEQYRRTAAQAQTMTTELGRRAGRRSWLRGALVRFFLSRAHALGGLREMPRYLLALMLAETRPLLRRVGESLVDAQVLAAPDDIFFLSLPEAYAALRGIDYRPAATSRRSVYEQELKRRRVPLVLLSDGTEPSVEQQHAGVGDETLQGIAASPGVVTAQAQVIFDPHGAQLARGSILVAPSTDPGWTPLFLTAGGLVVETGGEMSHGAIVAREYGIPAVVSVAGATELIQTGQQITVDGSSGAITLGGIRQADD